MNEQKLRELVAKWRSEAIRADRTAKKPSIGRRLEGNAYRVCADELEAALAASGEAPAESVTMSLPDFGKVLDGALAPPSTERSRALEDLDADAIAKKTLELMWLMRPDVFDKAIFLACLKQALQDAAPPTSAACLREKAGS